MKQEPDREMGALSGVQVVDLTAGIAGAVATMLMADFGAAVVRIEPPGGDPLRSLPGWATWSRGKQSATMSAGDAAARAALAGLLAGADICVTSDVTAQAVSPAALDALLAEVAGPRLIVLRMPPYLGPGDAPWAGGAESAELLSAALGISMRQSSFADGPVDPVYPHLLYEQGLWSAACAVAALVERERSGVGQDVTVSGAHGTLVAGSATFLVDPGAVPGPPAGPGGPSPCYTRYQCADGQWLFLGALTAKFQHPALGALGLAEIITDPRVGGQLDRLLGPDNRGWVRERMAAAFAARPREEWLKILDQAGVPAGPLMSRDGWLDHPQLRETGMRVEAEDPDRGPVVMPGIPLLLTRSPGAIRSPAPAVGPPAGELPGWPRPSAPGGAPAPATTAGPLHGVRVLDLGTILAGPFAGSLLAELGADVIKVEPPAGDPFRTVGFIYNRGMRSIAVDLQSDAGRAVFADLVRTADVVIDNYRPGVLQRLGIDYDALRAVSPNIISLSITGFGEGGPLAAQPGFDPILQGMSGMMAAQGGDSEPVFLTVAVNDVTAGAMSVLGTGLALYHRAVRGEGQRVWTSLDRLSAFMQSGELTRFDGRPAPRSGGADFRGPAALDRLYETRDGWVRLQASTADLPALRELGLLPASPGDVAAGDATWSGQLSAAFAARDRDDVISRLTAAGVTAAPARAIPELAADPDAGAHGLLHQHQRASGQPYYVPGRLAGFSRTRQDAALTAPGLGEHTRELLAELDYAPGRADELIAAGQLIAGPPLSLETFVSYR
ncbi:MAG TPA: CoA transferase [Streptosporangiaceae bacterium]|jgi:crotonobetainyl-CoA:carnitine CoA-transferase CaiB-like acyl-CoA transferase